MSSVLQEKILEYIREHELEQYATMDGFTDTVKPIEKTDDEYLLIFDLNKTPNPQKLHEQIDGLAFEQSQRLQGYANIAWKRARLVSERRRVGIPPKQKT